MKRRCSASTTWLVPNIRRPLPPRSKKNAFQRLRNGFRLQPLLSCFSWSSAFSIRAGTPGTVTPRIARQKSLPPPPSRCPRNPVPVRRERQGYLLRPFPPLFPPPPPPPSPPLPSPHTT